MSCTEITQDLENFVQEVMKNEEVNNYEIEIQGKSEKGENYLGEVTFFKVISQDNGTTYHLVMKTAKRSEELRKTMPIENAYRRELYMYSKVFPAFQQFLLDLNCKIKFNHIPKIYLVCNDENRESLIMENLKLEGFRLWDKSKAMEISHIISVLKLFGKYHGISLAMKINKPEIFEDLAGQLNNLFVEFSSYLDINILYGSLLKNAMSVLDKKGRSDLVSKFDKMDIKDILFEKTSEDDRLVICHGDCWNNNIMFKYEGTNSILPSNTYFVDFQLSMLDSPIKDLSYFLYTACDKSSLENFDVLLRTYHESLCYTLASLKIMDDVLPYETLKKSWPRYAKSGLILSMLVLKAEHLEPNEAPDLSKVVEDGGELHNSFNIKMKNQKKYDDRLFDVFTHFGDKFL